MTFESKYKLDNDNWKNLEGEFKSFNRYNNKFHDLCNFIERTTFAEGRQQPSRVTIKTLEDGIRNYLQFEHSQVKDDNTTKHAPTVFLTWFAMIRKWMRIAWQVDIEFTMKDLTTTLQNWDAGINYKGNKKCCFV